MRAAPPRVCYAYSCLLPREYLPIMSGDGFDDGFERRYFCRDKYTHDLPRI